jgi:mannose-6-phosphate isomerase-like protein (cupin superfamily)
MIEEFSHSGEIYAIKIGANFSKPGITFFTPDEFSQQLAYMKHSKGKVIEPHIHNLAERTVFYTNEVLIVKKGLLKVDFYDDEKSYLKSTEIGCGDILLLIRGGHGFEVLEDLEMIEVKQGPYVGEGDKTRFNKPMNIKPVSAFK